MATFIQQQLDTSSQYHGYRWIHQKCYLKGIVTDGETVPCLLQLLDGEGVQRRVYHSYGPTISGTLMAMTSLSHLELQSVDALMRFDKKDDPKIITGYFMDAVIPSGGCRVRFRLD